MKVLIADDDLVSRDVLKHNLAGHNCEIIEAENGDEGFKLAKEYSPDVIISDAMMPLVDGFQFLKKIKEEKKLKKSRLFFTRQFSRDQMIMSLQCRLGLRHL